MSRYLLYGTVMSGLLLAMAGNFRRCTQDSDERVLRKEFALPATAKLFMIDSQPKSLVREGLKIDATFEFTSTDFTIYLEQLKQDSYWKPLPLSRSFIIKITGIGRLLEYQKQRYELQGQSLPEPGSVYNPTEEQLLEAWMKKLPLDVKNGLYRCLTAGDNIMYASKIPCSQKPGDLNDFMLAVLDLDNKILRIKVHTAY